MPCGDTFFFKIYFLFFTTLKKTIKKPNKKSYAQSKQYSKIQSPRDRDVEPNQPEKRTTGRAKPTAIAVGFLLNAARKSKLYQHISLTK
jgi:hypothetical protein